MTSIRPLACCLTPLLLIALGGSSPAPAAPPFQIDRVAPGVYVGPAPSSPSDYRCLDRAGIHTVIDSRPFRRRARRRERSEVLQRGMSYLHIPIDFHPADDHAPHRVVSQLADPQRQPVYVHCQLGRDRTALVVALYRVGHLGWPPAAAYAEMQRRQFNPLLFALDRYFWQHLPATAATPLR